MPVLASTLQSIRNLGEFISESCTTSTLVSHLDKRTSMIILGTLERDFFKSVAQHPEKHIEIVTNAHYSSLHRQDQHPKRRDIESPRSYFRSEV